MDNNQAQNIQIHSVTVDKKAAEKAALMNNAMGGVVEANRDMHVSANNIQKRGFTYPGDKHQGWGFGGGGLHGLTGLPNVGPPFFGRGDGLGGLSLQPFGVGTNGLLFGKGLQPSIFSGSGSGTRYNFRPSRVSKFKMALAVEAYKGFGIVKNVIDLMCNFASEGLKIQHPRPAIQRFYERWAQLIDLQGRSKDILRYYYKYGNVFIYTTMGIVDPEAIRQMRSTRGDIRSVKALLSDDHTDPHLSQRRRDIQRELRKDEDARLIPWKYTLLNPFQMEITGTKFFGESEWVFVMDENTFKQVQQTTVRKGETVDVLDETDVNLPPEFKNRMKEDRLVQLDQTRLCSIHYMKDDHEDWADPMVWPVMNDIMYKNQLRSMDMSVINSTINAITIFKMGKIDQGYVAPPEHYREFSQMLRTPTYSHNIVWNDAIQMESNYPPIEKILGVEKYKSVDKDILAGLGIPGILVDGATGGSFSNAFLQVRTLLEKLEEGRREVIRWIDKQMRIIATTMGHREVPTVKFGQMSLRDEQAEKQLIIQLLDRGIISAEAVHEVFGLDTVQELERMRREQKLADDGVLVQHGPYKEPMTDTLEEELREMEFDQQDKQMKMQQKIKQDEMKTRKQQQQKQVKKQNGRPGGTKGIPQEKKRNTKPQGMGIGQLLEYEIYRTKASDVYEFVEDYLTNTTLKVYGAKYKKSLSRDKKNSLENLIYAVFSNINLNDETTEDTITSILENVSIDREFDLLMAEQPRGKTAAERRYKRISTLAMLHLKGDYDG